MTDPGPPTAVVVPLRSFVHAKERLSAALGATERERLVRDMAGQVVRSAGVEQVFVVSPDPEVLAWAADLGARAVADPGTGLDRAAASGVEAARQERFERAAVVAADLPLVDDLAPVTTGADGVALAPDRHGAGTNVCVVPTGAGFRFSYGEGSFARHAEEAQRLGLAVEVLRHEALAFDLDLPADLAALRSEHPAVAAALGVGP